MACKKCGAELSEGTKFGDRSGGRVQIRARKLLTVAAVILVLAIMAGMAAMLGEMAGMIHRTKEVFLLTEKTQIIADGQSTTRWEYEEDGRLVGYEYTQKNTGSGTADGLSWEYRYENGRIVSAKYRRGDVKFTLEYHYDRDGALQTVESREFQGQISCDPEGRIREAEIQGPTCDYTMSYSYHDNGMVKESCWFNGYIEEQYEYNERGMVRKRVLSYGGEKNTEEILRYDEKGNLLNRTTVTYSGGEEQRLIEETWEYNRLGEVTNLTLVKIEENQILWLECEVVRGNRTEEFLVTEIHGPAHLLGIRGEDLAEGSLYMIREFDRHGNLIREENRASGVETRYEYQAFEVSISRNPPAISDPEYFYGLSQ